MLFNSPIFIFLFLPITTAVYFLLNRRHLVMAAKAWLVASSLFFYAYWNALYLALILLSIAVNFVIGSTLGRPAKASPRRKHLLVLGVGFNLLLLGLFKYTDFFIANMNALANATLPLLGIILPLGISFVTFQQISFLVDSYRGEVREYDLLNYTLFVSFFPQLIAGPIVHHKEMMPQFASLRAKKIQLDNIYSGLVLFACGLAKKTILADTFAVWADYGFDNPAGLHLVDAWTTALSYSFQIYFDFSGYMDMALGAALLFNIKLPVNFNSPYKAVSIQDFWRRWHITLGRFLREYLYIPLGGDREGQARTIANLMIVFMLGGLWHGASWTFVVWGAIHGVAMVLHRIWKKLGKDLPRMLSWAVTFTVVCTAWVFFRASTISDALEICRGMLGLNGIQFHPYMKQLLNMADHSLISFGPWSVSQHGGTVEFAFMLLCGFVGCLLFKPMRLIACEGASLKLDAWGGICFAAGVVGLSRISEFIYFQF